MHPPKRTRYVTVNIPILDGIQLRICHCTNLVRTARRMGMDDWKAFEQTAAFVTTELDHPEVIYLVLGPAVDEFTVVHEVVHVAWRIAKYHNIEKSEEIMAYIVENVMRLVWKALRLS